ncbi:Aldehyde dehydrogenase family protein [Aphelenchoides besseyi]|nr:Aldehyde dehydrogenase family protein [Aphelenchoides besseyi]
MRSTEAVLKYLLEDSSPVAKNYINGQFENPKDGKWLDSEEPATGRTWLKVADSNEADVDDAVAAAHSAFKSWSETSADYRAALLNKVADIVEKNLDAFAQLESKDQGKTVQMARQIEIPRCIKNFRAFAAAIQCHTNPSSFLEQPIRALSYVKQDPVGVSVLICPWNLPLYLLSFKLAPALACGNTVVCKPSEMTSATAYALMHAFVEAGFPSGVVNMVLGTGPQVGERMCSHKDVNLISFTGSTPVGRHIAALAAPAHKKLSLELGGKNASIVFDDVVLDDVIPTIVRSCFANQGEICLCTSRLYVQNTIYESFLHRLVLETKKIGDPNDADTYYGALISRVHYDKVNSYIKYAKQEGYTIHCGGPLKLEGRLEELSLLIIMGHFIAPTIISDLPHNSKLFHEEIFGPVVAIARFDTAAEAVELANSVEYGLSASVWSRSTDNLMIVANKLRVGTVWCNCWLVRDLRMPFGGTKQSGTGREGTEDSIHFFTEQKTVCLKFPHEQPIVLSGHT